jgi:hypothetical protein
METLTFTKADLASPCVYVVWEKEVPAYVGVGTKGIRRVFSIDPTELRGKAMKDCTEIVVSFYGTEKKAIEAEADLIHLYHPEQNRHCPRCNHYIRAYPRRPSLHRFFGEIRSDVLSALFEHPEKAFFTREIGRMTNRSVGCVLRELKNLTEVGLLRRFTQGNQVCYQAEILHPIFHEIRDILRKERTS